jgi:hypothetical protein
MIKSGAGTFKYVSGWYAPSSLPGAVIATYDGKAKNAQLVISHGCRPFNKTGAWCSPGFWGRASQVAPSAWTLINVDPNSGFNGQVSTAFYGQSLNPDASLITVLTTTGSTYKGAGVAGTDPRTQPPNPALNPFNATGAYLTDLIPCYKYDPNLLSTDDSSTCPIDHFGHYKDTANKPPACTVSGQ